MVVLFNHKGSDNVKKVITYFKRADIEKNRVIIPIWFIRKHGREFYMEMHDDKIVLIPLNKVEK